MKILYVSKLAPHLGMRRIYEVGRRLSAGGHDVVALCASTHPDQPRDETVEGVRVVALRTAPKALRRPHKLGFFATRLPFYLMNPNWVKRHGSSFDVVVEDVAPLWTPGLPRVCAGLSVPLVYQTHNAYPSKEDWVSAYGLKGVIGHILHQRMIRSPGAAGIYADSKWSTDALAGVPCPVRWIPNGADLDVFKPDTSTKHEGDQLVLLNVARLVPLKNQELLLRAVAAAGVDARLRILGDGPEMGRLSRLVNDLGLGSSVSLEGHAGQDELAEAYRRADVFVLPSLYEGMPQSTLEAMASGLPVAMADIPAAEGVVEDSYGWLLNPRSVEAWASAIERWSRTERSELRRMGRIARATVADRFTWDAAAEAELEFLGELVGAYRR